MSSIKRAKLPSDDEMPDFDQVDGGAFDDEGTPDLDGDGSKILDKLNPTGKGEEADSKQEVGETLRAIREADKRERDRHANTLDTEYWACLVFNNRAQKEEFLRQIGWLKFGDKYLDGMKLAKRHGFKLPDGETTFVPEKTENSLVTKIGTIEPKPNLAG